jgi:cytochrome c oxidase assembly protein subunit 15
LRVILFKDQIGIFHATLAQLFFVLTSAIALFTSKWWMSMENSKPETGITEYGTRNTQHVSIVPRLFLATTLLILFQLILGATMRHQHAGLSIHDFPLAYGKLWPATDAASVARYNEHRVEITNYNPITAFQIQLQMVHRIVAVLILCAVAFCAWQSWRKFSGPLAKLSAFWFVLILCQAGLGAATVLSDKAADISTAHVLVGALSLATGAMLSIIAARFPQRAVGVSPAEVLSGAPTMDINCAIEISSAGKLPAAR